MIELNEKFCERMKKLLGEGYPQFFTTLNQPKENAILLNTNKICKSKFEEIADFDIEKINFIENGYYVKEKLGRHALHHAGAFYCQEPNAMLTASCIEFHGDEKVLDLCAAPGGKTIQISNKIPNGCLVSNEIDKTRAQILYSNVERMGLKNVIITNNDSGIIAKAYANTFDICFVDAPCSGEGMFRRGEKVCEEWNENLPKMCANRQLEILENANKTLQTGGVLVYSTCTYSLEENEEVVLKFLSKHNYVLQNIELNISSRGINMPEVIRLYPHKTRGEGQFVAVMKKLETNEEISGKSMKLTPTHLADKFLKDNLNFSMQCFEYKKNIYMIPCEKLVKNDVNYVSLGVKIGEDCEHRFEPDHYLFSAFGTEMKRTLNFKFSSKEISSYLKGETFNADLPDGYGCVLVEGCALGGFKISAGKFKNHYPKGLRNFK